MKLKEAQIDVYQQGNLDGLCGIYAVVHFFMRKMNKKDIGTAKKVFRLCLQAVNENFPEDEGVDSYFREKRLISACTQVSLHYGLPILVEQLKKFKQINSVSSIHETLICLQPDEGLILSLKKPKHWVLAHSPSKTKFWIDDSAEGRSRRVLKETVNGREFYSDRGLVLKNAQTH